MDWPSFTSGAFLACVALFALCALAFTHRMRSQFLLWVFIRAVMIGVLVVTFAPLGDFVFATPENATLVRVIATDLSIALTGPLLATYIEPEIAVPRVRKLLWAMLPGGAMLATLAPSIAYAGRLDWLHDFLILVLLGMLITGIAKALQAGSRPARFQAIAWAPGLAVGLVALYHELLLMGPMPIYAQAMLAAFLIEFVVTAAGIADGFMVMKRQRDEAYRDIDQARLASATDPLTGIANRRGLAREFAKSPRGRPDAVAVIDCDHFKRVNDMFGHDVGDEVLIAVAQALESEAAFPARMGGEEFVALLYGSDWQRHAERIRRQITIAVMEAVPELPFPVTASAGATAITAQDSLDDAFKRADKALYAAKDAGRDRLLVQSQGGTIGPRLVVKSA